MAGLIVAAVGCLLGCAFLTWCLAWQPMTFTRPVFWLYATADAVCACLAAWSFYLVLAA